MNATYSPHDIATDTSDITHTLQLLQTWAVPLTALVFMLVGIAFIIVKAIKNVLFTVGSSLDTQPDEATQRMDTGLYQQLNEQDNVCALRHELELIVTDDETINADKKQLSQALDNLLQEATTGSRDITPDQLHVFDTTIETLTTGAKDIRQQAEKDRLHRLDATMRYAENLYIPSALDDLIGDTSKTHTKRPHKTLIRIAGDITNATVDTLQKIRSHRN